MVNGLQGIGSAIVATTEIVLFCLPAEAAELKKGRYIFMVKQWELPAGYDLETVTAYAEEQERRKRREWNRNHPELVEQQRIRTYCRFLAKRGFTVTDPEGVTVNG